MAFNLGAITGALEETKDSSPGVDFSGRALKLDTENDAKPIVEAISKCASLRCLNLTGNTLGVEAAEAIARALASRPELECARWSDMFTGRMKTEIPPALSALGRGMIEAGTRLTVLELSDNAFGPIGVQGLAKLLESEVCSQLQELRLNNNGLGITGGRLLAKALLGSAPPRLKLFIAGRNRLENDGAKALAEVFKKMGSLEEIAMPQNGIYHVGISALCEAFRHNPRLHAINLNDNTIGPKGAAAFAKVLPKLKELQSINFGDCLLKSKGAIALAAAFRDNNIILQTLDLSHNEIGAAACREVVSAVAHLPGSLDRLEKVVLSGNKLGGAAGKKSILEKLGACAALSDEENSDDECDEESEEDTDSCGSDEDESNATEPGDQDTSGDLTLNNSGEVEEVMSEVGRFLREPTIDNFTKLGPKPVDAIDEYLQSIPDAVQATEAYVEATMLVSGLGVNARSAARELLACTVRSAGARHAAQWTLTNSLLVHTALIKSENKSFKIRWDLAGCYAVLSDVIDEPFVPESLRETIKFFARSKRDKDPESAITKYPKLCG